MSSQFREELAYYNTHREDLLSRQEWKYVLIKGSELFGTFDNPLKAYEEGLRRFGNTAFLIKQILREEIVQQVPALTLGLIHANR